MSNPNTQTQTTEEIVSISRLQSGKGKVELHTIIFSWVNSINKIKHNKLKQRCLIGLDIYNFIDARNIWTLLRPHRCDTGHKRNNELWKIISEEMITDSSQLQSRVIFYYTSCDKCQITVQMKVVSSSSAGEILLPDYLAKLWRPCGKSHSCFGNTVKWLNWPKALGGLSPPHHQQKI